MNVKSLFPMMLVIILASKFLAPSDATSPTYLPVIVQNYCPPLYVDRFDNLGSGWPVSDDGNVLYAYSAGEYWILIRNPDGWAGASSGFKSANFIVDVDIRYGDLMGEGFQGLLFGISDDWKEYYRFVYQRAKYWGIDRYSASSPYQTNLANGQSDYINGGTSSNHLRIERTGPSIKAYANGHLLADLVDGSYIDPRKLGVITTSSIWGNQAYFDNFIVYNPGCGALPISANRLAQQ
jgi:hypothetical protein